MKRERTLNLAWPLVVLLAVLLLGGGAWGVGAILFEDPATRKSYPSKTVAGYLGAASGGLVEVQTMAQPTQGQVLIAGCGTDTATGTATVTCARFGASASGLPSGTPGQVPTISAVTATGTVTATATQTSTGTGTVTYTLTSTGTVTTTATEYTATNGTVDFDPLGIYYVSSAPSEGTLEGPGDPSSGRWARSVSSYTGGLRYLYYEGTCSSGNDALIMDMTELGPLGLSTTLENNAIWPGGNWLADLRAKVDANGAGIRIEVWETGNGDVQWFNWTTDVFTNTSYNQIRKLTAAPERVPSNIPNVAKVKIKLYATCSSSTTVSVQVAHVENEYKSRIYSPMRRTWVSSGSVFEYSAGAEYGYKLSGYIFALESWRYNVEQDLLTIDEQKQDNISAGTPGQVVGYLGTGTSVTTSIGPVDREPVISGTPGQFVKFAGTGTATTTSKEAGYPGITSRSNFVQANMFTIAEGATTYSASYQAWLLADGSVQRVFGAFFLVPMDASSSTLTVRPAWTARATDSSSHSVRWVVYYSVMTDGASSGSSMTSAAFMSPAKAHTANYFYLEDGTTITASAGSIVKLAVERTGNDWADTYIGDVALLGLRVDYTSSL
jgi:hypothetical protein